MVARATLRIDQDGPSELVKNEGVYLNGAAGCVVVIKCPCTENEERRIRNCDNTEIAKNKLMKSSLAFSTFQEPSECERLAGIRERAQEI